MIALRRSARQSEWLFLSILSLWCLLSTASEPHSSDEIVVEADPFLLRLSPKPEDFPLEKRVTVLWTVENIIREYFEEKYKESKETLFIGAGITGLSLVPPEDANTTTYETIKFLGGAVAFHPASTFTPSKNELQSSFKDALRQDGVKSRLVMYFPGVQQVIYVPLVLGNRGFAAEEELGEDASNDGPATSYATKPVETYEQPPLEESGSVADEGSVGERSDNGIEGSYNSAGTKTTVGLSAGVALGGAIIVLLIALLIESRRRRMAFWREYHREDAPSLSMEVSDIQKDKASPIDRYYTDDEQETALRLPRVWGVSPSQRMDSRTTPGSSEVSASYEGDSVQEILTCTSMDRRSIQNVESFEHQKRLVDTLKKEMMASNAEIHPYMQDTHLDNTEPCALSPTDFSAAALENEALTRPVTTWHPPSESSFTGSGSGSGCDSSSSPIRVMMRDFQLSTVPKEASRERRLRILNEPDSAEL